MSARIGVRILLVSRDIQTIDTLCHFMGRMTMHVEVCSDADSATRKLCHSKFEGVVVDFNDPAEALELLKKPRQMTSHRAAVVFAVLNNDSEMPSAFRAGASFVIVRPLNPAALMRTLRASYPLMVRESRRSFRCSLQVPVYVSVGFNPESMATSANISEEGMAIANAPTLPVGERIGLRLTLPGSDVTAKIQGEVCWSDNAGRLGVQFVQIPRPVKEHLVAWLMQRLEESLPEEVVLNR